jgi:lysophospholipase L1-like esterase
MTRYRQWLVRVLLLACLVSAVPANAATKIAAVGDSITQGFPYYTVNGNGCTNCGQYTWRLEALLDADSNWSPSTVYNYGVGGETSNKGAARIPGIISSLSPEYVLFMEGTNDLPSANPATVSARVEIAVNNILASGKIPVVGTLLPDLRGGGKDIIGTNTRIRSMLEQKDVQLADLYNATSSWGPLLGDGLHPNYSGYQLMAETWYAALPSVSFLPAVYLLLLD